MRNRSFPLFIISTVSIVLFFTIPVNFTWLHQKIYASVVDFPLEGNHMSIDDRRAYKYRNSYVILMQAADFLNAHNAYDPVVLLPPNAFLRAQHMDLVVPEPVVFYYYTGLRAVWTNSSDVESATWALMNRGNKVHLVRLRNKQELDQLLSLYKKYPPTL